MLLLLSHRIHKKFIYDLLNVSPTWKQTLIFCYSPITLYTHTDYIYMYSFSMSSLLLSLVFSCLSDFFFFASSLVAFKYASLKMRQLQMVCTQYYALCREMIALGRSKYMYSFDNELMWINCKRVKLFFFQVMFAFYKLTGPKRVTWLRI